MQRRILAPHYLGFTLIELLVVVAIIAVLIAILLPGLANARYQAKNLVCVSNEHQMYLGNIMFVDENGGWLPDIWNGSTRWWQVLIDRKYITFGVNQCPLENGGAYGRNECEKLSQGTGGTVGAVKLREYVNPSRKIILGDSSGGIYMGIALGRYAMWHWSLTETYAISPRHQEGANFLMADGQILRFDMNQKPYNMYDPASWHPDSNPE